MKTMLTAVCLCAAALTTAVPARAETVEVAPTSNVPFSFTLKGQQFPAGKYKIEQDLYNSYAVLIHEESGKRTKVLRPNMAVRPDKAHLVFRRGAEGYRLAALR